MLLKEEDRLDMRSLKEIQGPIVSFNILRSDGSYVGYNEVSKLAALNRTPIQIRTGCFCNPGACLNALALDEEKAKVNYTTKQKVCGDHIDIIDGAPTGCVRMSIGKDSIWEDTDEFVSFIIRTFVDNDIDVLGNKEKLDKLSSPGGKSSNRLRLEEIYVFPIKSCAGTLVSVTVVH